jgi:hypothetical protein
MNTDHYAIVIGLSQYSELGPPPAELHGPENDADAVYAWLTDPNGGGLPAQNVKLIKSSDFRPPNAKPVPNDFDDSFLWISRAAQNNGLRVGKRFYFYLAGHGFSTPDR